MKSSLILSSRDLHFLLFDWLDVAELTKRERFADHSTETFEAVLDLAETIATRDFAPHNRTADVNEPRLVDGRVQLIPEVAAALSKFADSGLLAAHADASLGGLQLPSTVAKAAMAWFQAANVATSAYAFLSVANANLLVAHGTEVQIDSYARPLLAGRFFGTMCLSEPGAGSSLADLTTTAHEQPDGTYRLFGNKMWISGGDHEMSENIIHLVLARTPDAPAGVRGISLFVVPKFLLDDDGAPAERNDIVTAGLNHKMGYRGTTNAALNFGEGAYRPGGGPGAVGFLVGARNAGLQLMFHMMNEARVGVGVGAAALGYTGYLHSLDYAKTRLQGRPATDRDPSKPQVPIIEHPDVRRMLLAQKSYVEGGLALGLYCARLVDDSQTASEADDRLQAALLLDVLTPIVKSWPSQWCLAANDLAIQVLGGYGYTRDYPVEQFYRDNRLNPIHEGTHGIQAADLLGRKVVHSGGAGLDAFAAAVRATIARAGRTEHAVALSVAVASLVAVTHKLHGTGDPASALANASSYLEAFGHIVVAWIWLEQELAAAGRGGDFYDGKRAAAQYFFRFELPKARTQLELLDSLDATVLETAPAWL
ncbi:acyl-CoA dehydrogenase [Jatrophihabitans sp.]|uniref:acyl-CoA dehydrogenase n=1 Tax=Jatrophihabitans sp. TaxID=1932789 RepID=UPI0030C6D382|nr:Acyl-CoA dehydrogenase [Jatrophihabitans sp.]